MQTLTLKSAICFELGQFLAAQPLLYMITSYDVDLMNEGYNVLYSEVL